MKKIFSLLVFCVLGLSAFADHLKGGFFTYEYLGVGNAPNSSRYHVQLTVYMTCFPSAGQITNPIPFSFFDAGTNQLVQDVQVSISQQYRLQKSGTDACVIGDQSVCYYIVIYDLPSIELPNNANGYTVAYQRCCRIIDIKNMPGTPASNTIGNTYSTTIPGSNTLAAGQHNSSPVFLINDTALVCFKRYFEVPFIATDPVDHDSLSYFFCDAQPGGGQGGGTGPGSSAPDPAANPPYGSIPYAAGFGGSFPLGNQVTINPQTGMISGIAPATPGEYVVAVCVNEYRQGVYIATTRKELHLKVGDCSGIKATLNPQYVTCDGFNLSFSNQTNNGVNSYVWDFGDPSTTTDVSNSAAPTYTYSDTGTYIIKLVVNQGSSCPDSTTALAKVYPGFFPGFTFTGVCANKPTQFLDTSHTRYGFIDSWSWNFGDLSTLADTSHLQNPSYSYPSNGVKNVRFIVTSNKGCIDTVFKDVTIIDKPPLTGQPKDTLICNGATVQLGAVGSGNFSWAGPNIVNNGNTQNPIVAPTSTSNYVVTLNDNGCLNTDTVQVRVVNVVSLQGMPDSIICATDSVQLRLNSNALHYTWTPALTLNNASIQNPKALPVNSPTTYHVVASIDHCNATDDIVITLAPYPTARAGNDTVICFNSPAQLHASIVGTSFTWTPSASLDNPNSLDPIARPAATTTYILSVTDNVGCPKPKKDTIVVTVLSKIIAFAGVDTAVVVGQPLQFNASGGVGYFWTPSTGLNHNNIANPVGIYNGNFDSIRYKVLVNNQAGCVDSAFVSVRIFRTNPQIFVPTAFTPNGDGLNDYVRPIAVGISKMDYFRIYNRWGQLVYSSEDLESKGWDGKIGGKDQATAVFVWLVRGTDYTGKVVFAKGTVALIR